MAKFPTYKEMGKKVAEEALDGYIYHGKTIREWVNVVQQWQELKETIIELRDSDGTGTQQEICSYLTNYMGVLEKNMSSLENPNRTGHWIRGINRHFLDTRTNVNVEMKKALGKGYHTYINVQCSECHMVTIHDDSIAYQYCPHCGAKMIELKESENEE